MEPELAAEFEWKESSVQFNKEMVVNIDQAIGYESRVPSLTPGCEIEVSELE
jgi:hypothetical protein